MFITKDKLNKLIDKKIKESFDRWGFYEEEFNHTSCFWPFTGINKIYPWEKDYDRLSELVYDLQKKNDLLTEYLGVEYYKLIKKAKATDSDIRGESIEEGYRKIKGRKNNK